jgi:hypothetical protein
MARLSSFERLFGGELAAGVHQCADGTFCWGSRPCRGERPDRGAGRWTMPDQSDDIENCRAIVYRPEARAPSLHHTLSGMINAGLE